MSIQPTPDTSRLRRAVGYMRIGDQARERGEIFVPTPEELSDAGCSMRTLTENELTEWLAKQEQARAMAAPQQHRSMSGRNRETR